MASIGTSEPPRLAEYHVFLSFRGLDTRTTFTDFLYHGLNDAGIRVFRDDEELDKGKELASELPRAISNSRICIPIFSKNYAKSTWCLREAAHMVESWEKTKGEVVIVPIFYDVDVSEVKLRSGSYKDDIEKHRARFEEEIIDQWKKALVQMGGMKGWTLNDAKGQGELVKRIVHDLSIKLKVRYMNLPSRVVGLDNDVDALMELIDVDSEGVKFIVIHGMGGLGKTTLAKVIFNRLVNSYEGYSFIDNVRESKITQGMLGLQKKLLSDVLNPTVAKDINDTNGGINMIRERMGSKRVLIVLDDVDEGNQLQNLAGRSAWFGSGSRIIITTRNRGVLAGQGESDKYFYHELGQMGSADALSLFSWHAFRKDNPPEDYGDLSTDIVSAMGCLPLAVEVIGSMLFCKCKTFWQDTFDKLKRVPDQGIEDTLMISIEKLDIQQTQVFLDVACFLIGVDITNAIYMWSDCGYAPHNALKFLVELSLLKRLDENKLWMHDLVRDLGRKMIQEGRHSRVWDSQEARYIVEGKRGTDVIEVLMLEDCECTITHDAISNLENLRYLTIRGENLKGDFMNHLPNLRWLTWSWCPKTFKAVNFHPTNLVVLDLYRSYVTENWGGWKQLKAASKLKVLDLSFCSKLKKTPDFSSFLELEKLILQGCHRLVELDPSICKLKHLTRLDMGYCQSLRKLPENIGDLKSLVELDISYSKNLHELPDSIGNIESMKAIKLRGSSIRKLPTAIGLLQNLEVIRAEGCQNLNFEFPVGMEGLSLLKIFNFAETSVHNFPKSLTGLSHLEELRFCLPNEFEPLQFPELPSSLKSLEIQSSYGLDSVPDLSYLTNLTNLELDSSRSSKTSLCWIARLSKLEKMKIGSPGIITLPQEMASLSKLKDIRLRRVELLCLPGLPSGLEILRLSSLKDSRSLEETIPCLKDLQILRSLDISSCRFSNLDGLHFLSSLRNLVIWDYDNRVPDLSSLRKLKSLDLDGCEELVEIEGLGDLILLEELRFCDCNNLEGIYGLSNLRNLKVLGVGFCRKLTKIQGIDQLPALFRLVLTQCDSLVLDTSKLDIRNLSVFGCPNVKPRRRSRMIDSCLFKLKECFH